MKHREVEEDGEIEIEYLVDWLGYGEGDRTWEREVTLVADIPHVVKAYHERVRQEMKGKSRK